MLFPVLIVVCLWQGVREIRHPERFVPREPQTRWEKFCDFFWMGRANETGIRINGVLCILFSLVMGVKLLELVGLL